MRTLLAGGFVSELGWEVATWVPAIRRYSRKFDNTVIVCRTGYEYLYGDIADVIINYDKKGLPDRWLLNGKKVKMPKKIKEKYKNATVITPRKSVCMEWKRKYVKYGEKRDECTYDLVIHARACTKYGQRSWNYHPRRYEKILKRLNLNRVCCVGTQAHYIAGTEDLRNIPLKKLCDILASSRLCIGTSSGLMHLASMCGCPHIVFTWDKWQKSINGTNKDRYKKIWNPFKTPCKVLDQHNWQPPVGVVVKAIDKLQ